MVEKFIQRKKYAATAPALTLLILLAVSLPYALGCLPYALGWL
jgi:hypothetical protein